MVTQELLKEYFDYLPEGNLVWKKKNGRGKQGQPGAVAGSTRKDGYVEVGFFGRHLLHRLIFLFHKGYLPPLIDHADQDHTNNRISNLRESDKRRNGLNSDKVRAKSGYKGVSIRNNRYIAMFSSKYVGSFGSAEEASAAYERARASVLNNIGDALNDDEQGW